MSVVQEEKIVMQEDSANTVSPEATDLPIRMEAHGVDFYYGDFQALHDISLPLYERQITALIGPSGCGKSTFLRTLNRMNDHDLIPGTRLVGKILLDSQDVYASDVDPYELRRRVGMVFQRPNPFPKSIYENVAYGPRIHGTRRKSELDDLVEQCLRQAALWEEVKDKLKQSALALSGGQQQRLCIARALATQPEVLLMDEPASALDPNSTRHIEDLMLELKANYTIAIVTHNMQQAARISDWTAFFFKGVVKEFGRTAQIFGAPNNEETRNYVQGRFG
ncbi:MAG: phosphate ABC transporter ATP-binding protein PstB [Armatimonadaceae bacterium]